MCSFLCECRDSVENSLLNWPCITTRLSLAACRTGAPNFETDAPAFVSKRPHFFLCSNKSISHDSAGTPLNGSGQSVSSAHLAQPDRWSPIIWLAVPREMIWFNRRKHDQPHPKHIKVKRTLSALRCPWEAEEAVGGLCPELRTPCPCCLQPMIYVRRRELGLAS